MYNINKVQGKLPHSRSNLLGLILKVTIVMIKEIEKCIMLNFHIKDTIIILSLFLLLK
jgi:hypothetical protein